MSQPSTGRTRRKVLGDATLRANEDNSAQRRRADHKAGVDASASSPRPLPHNESLVPNGTLAVKQGLQPSPSPQHKRLSAVINDGLRPHNPKRDSEISNASTNASSTNRRRKTHIGPWQLGRTIGRGGCSRVRVVRHRVTGEHGAAKIVSKAMADQLRALSLVNLIESAETDPSLMGTDSKFIPFGLEREICIMKLLDHRNIVRLHDIWENRNEIYLIMECIDGGELFQYIAEQRTAEIGVVHLFRQIIAALIYCHRLCIHHRDLKPENILLDRASLEIKLVDFGMAALQPPGKLLTTACGSPHYAAPEVIRGAPYDGAMADIWSCGIILFMMLTGNPPFNYSGEESHLKHLFQSICKAEYRMPPDISLEAQDLIRRILVPNPANRITIEEIWDHPFMHKYDKELGFQGEEGTLEYWVGPAPTIPSWVPLNVSTVDREILRYLRTLWHSEKEEVLVSKLVNDKPNLEKYFYSALVSYRTEQLENYTPGLQGMGYSRSDHHHHVARRAPTRRDIRDSPKSKSTHSRSRSTYSIMNNEHLYSKHSFYEPPSSDASYDPFRASRGPLMPTGNPNVTVNRGSTSGSRKSRPATALGHRSVSSLRVKALRNNSIRQGSLGSKRSTPSARSGQSVLSASRRRSVSRSSMASSHWPSSPPVLSRPASHKRGVSFSHMRRSSATSNYTTGTNRAQFTPEQQSSRSSHSSAAYTLSPRRRIPKSAVSPVIPRVRMRKPESPSRYIQSEVRKVSTELGKVMEEAFNRSSLGDNVRSAGTGHNKDVSEVYDTPPTSFANTRDSGCSNIATLTPGSKRVLSNRPLPPIPDETPADAFLQRKLAETREEIARHAERDGDSTGKYSEVLEHLDTLMRQPTQRASSAPTRPPEYHPAPLPAISEELKGDSEERYESCQPLPQRRAVTDPVRPTIEGRRAVTEQLTTIRVVDRSPTPIAPLNIRKKSGASTLSKPANEADAGSRPATQAPVRPYQEVRDNLKAARPTETTVSDPGLLDKKEHTLKKKKSSWFRRNPEEKEEKEKDRQQTLQHKPSTGRLDIPEAWQGLDDRFDKAPRFATATVTQHPSRLSHRSDSTEFPTHHCVTSGSSLNPRKSFLGLFGKKQKDEKTKYPNHLAIQSSTFSSSSRFSSSFDFSEEDNNENPSRQADVQMNWLHRFLHIKPAVKVLCFQVGRKRTRKDILILLKDWQRFGVNDLHCEKDSWTITASVGKDNHLKIKPFWFVVELFCVLENGRKRNLTIARFTQTKGAASSFRKVADIAEDVFRSKGMLVEDEAKEKEMIRILKVRN